MSAPAPLTGNAASHESQLDEILEAMTLAEKIGQLCQLDAGMPDALEQLGDRVRAGAVGALLNAVEPETIRELQRIATDESRLGIPLLIGRDVIHGFATVMPIPLAQAASWNRELVRRGARAAAREASARGINWTFAPMLDVSRDPRWGRVAECLGEDPYLASELAAAMVLGFQTDDPANAGAIAACAKHFAGYGTVEAGIDYAATNVPPNEMANVYLPPFKAAVDNGVLTLMTSFSDLDGIPATANASLLRDRLRDEWGFRGLVVSDWDSIRQLEIHGLTADAGESALAAITAGVDMEMAGDAYSSHLERHVEQGRVSVDLIDSAVRNVLRVKLRLGLIGKATRRPSPIGVDDTAAEALSVARELAENSAVLLGNQNGLLPLSASRLTTIALIGPLADAPYEQLGTWIFDGDRSLSVTPRQAIDDLVGERVEIRFAEGLQNSRSVSTTGFADAQAAAADADVAIVFVGEESILSGEAHSRADIHLPGAQAELIARVRQTGTPVVAVVMAGRPLVLSDVVDNVDALLYAWHGGTMAGPALARLLFGHAVPSAKLPMTLPRMVGQIPIYYSRKNSGKPPMPATVVMMDEIDAEAPQTSTGMSAYHLDAGFEPLFPFGFGLSYTTFDYAELTVARRDVAIGTSLAVAVRVANTGGAAGDEIVQLYVRDIAASITRPVRELKAFRRVHLAAGEVTTVRFELHTDRLAFHGRDGQPRCEPGEFQIWVGGSSLAELTDRFTVVDTSA